MSTVEDYDKMSDSAKAKEDWMNKKWRPAMGWMYMLVCVMDFVIFPILWSMIQVLDGDGRVESQWQPITLQGAGLFHIAMGAILGIAAYGRTQEKLNDKAGATPAFGPTPVVASAPSFGSVPLGNNTMSTVPAFKPAPASTPSPFAAPQQPPHPEI